MLRLAFFLAAGLGAAATMPAAPTAADYAGKWDLTILGTGSSFSAGSLLVRADGDALGAELVWRFGSVERNFDKVEVNDAGELLIHKASRWSEPLRLVCHGDTVEGQAVEKKGATFPVHGSRAVEITDAAGSWDMTVTFDNGDTASGVLKLESLGGGRYDGSALDADGNSIPVRSVELDGRRLRAKLSVDDGARTVALDGEILGDRFIGKADDGERIIDLKGERRRRFGPAIALLATKGTATTGIAGWHPRDHSRACGWTCTNGVLENGDHDVDIVSDASFGDFRLELEYKVERAGSNSGIYLRGRYEVQIVGNDRLGDHSNGAVYSRLKPKVNPFSGVGEWQRVEITLIGRYVTVVMNGQVVQDNAHIEGITGGALLPREHEPGPLMLQGDHGKIYFRNVKVFPAR